jgi:CO/xanthine dehydrogenase FAD-binding subunit
MSVTNIPTRFRPDDYILPETVEEAVSTLAKEGDRAKVIAGGTLFFELVERNMIPKVKKIIDISKLGLNYIRVDGGQVKIGSTTTLTDILEDKTIAKTRGIEALFDALNLINPVQIRNVATLGGEVCGANPLFDLPPVLIALNARGIFYGSKGERPASLDGFILDYFLCDMKPEEILKEIQIPVPKPSSASAFAKLQRTAEDFAVVSCAASVSLTKDSKCEEIVVVLGAATRLPTRITKVEKKNL